MNTQTTPTKGSHSIFAHPLGTVGIVFGGIGLIFTLLGATFAAANAELLPQVFTAAAWGNDTPDELALPIIGVIFAGMGLLFLLIGVAMLLILRRQRLLRQELERYGIRVTGTVTDIVPDRTCRVNGRSPLRVLVTVTHPTTGEAITVRSGPVWETTLSSGDTAEVLFDPMDEKKHVVVLSE
ncbi:MAG: hypothetical protein IJE07_05775 [Clostridia bacterium]|nr:hypothetical protein [Clostridia bacterium]